MSRVIGELGKEAQREGYWQQAKNSLHKLSVEVEALSRRCILLVGGEDGELQETLWWMAENGIEEDLELLEKARSARGDGQDEISQLFDLAEARIRDRTGRRKADEILERVIQRGELGWEDAARQLSSIGIWSRGSILPRGSISEAAEPRIDSRALIRALNTETEPVVICVLASALGEWAGGEAVRPLALLLESATNLEIRMYCIAALGIIGGESAVESLRGIIEGATSDQVRDAALAAVEELAVGGGLDFSQGLCERSSALGRAPLSRMATSLEMLRDSEDTSAYMRKRVEDLLPLLVEEK
jgi:hypothetical protein